VLGEKPDISIIIVNYRVKNYISLLLDSINKAKKDLKIEIFIVDNNSQDDSIEYLSRYHQDIIFIKNENNKGFGKANNQALEQVSGTYTLIINPDTILEEDSLSELKKFMDLNSDCGAAGLRMINPDGTFAKECKRSVPTLKSAIFRVLGLDSVFPNNKLFGERYLSWLSQSEVAKVPVISGAGMFWRTNLLKDLNGFDEDFFMYGEDDDLCFRVQNTEFNIQYFPPAQLLHFKGESEVSLGIKNLKKVNSGLIHFFKKHYQEKYNKISYWLISIAFYLRLMIIYFKMLLIKEKVLFYDKETLFIVVGERDVETLAKILKKNKGVEIRTVSISSNIEALSKNILSISNELSKTSRVIFDVDSISYKNALGIMEALKNQKFSFHFFLNKENKIIGKSSVIDL
tara:strand:+ start:3100 stop:4302 length:1203 start_codon:yes stop_codon:yes gene_type:complete